jgi:hypothetical protein
MPANLPRAPSRASVDTFDRFVGGGDHELHRIASPKIFNGADRILQMTLCL